MRRLVLALAAAVSLGAAAQAGDAVPWKAVRALQALEDRIATGDTLAQAARAKAVARLGASFAAMPSDTWRDARNARALVAFLLGGGDAAEMARAIPVAAVNKDAEALYRGALSYGAGDDEGARALLLPVEAKAQPAGIAGRLALVQATLVEPTDKGKALALLDLARLVEPGTLVEEAALRKEMAISGAGGDLDKLGLLERRYQAAFARSVYVENFRRLVADFAVAAAAANDAAGNDHLARLVAPLGRDERRRILLAIARKETLAGHVESATFAASRALDLCDRNGRDEARAQVYFGAAALVGSGYDKAAVMLASVVPERLDDRDRSLRLAALDMSASLRADNRREPGSQPPVEGATPTRAFAAIADAEAAVRSVKP